MQTADKTVARPLTSARVWIPGKQAENVCARTAKRMGDMDGVNVILLAVDLVISSRVASFVASLEIASCRFRRRGPVVKTANGRPDLQRRRRRS